YGILSVAQTEGLRHAAFVRYVDIYVVAPPPCTPPECDTLVLGH
ncbi:unnamed protein product, partial [marine sediment metagenome]